jgi:hypothetical protein
MGLSLMNMIGLSSSTRIVHIAYYWKFFRKSPVSTGFTEKIKPILRILCYNGSLVTWMVISLTATKFKPLIFSMFAFASQSTLLVSLLYNFSMDRIENTASKNSSVVACLFVATEMCLFSCYPSVDNLFWLHYSGFQPLCHNIIFGCFLFSP